MTSLVPGTGERTELSATSLANAAAKIANALRDEFELDSGGRVGLHLPLHWQRACWLAGAWTAGCAVEPHGVDVDLVVTGPAQAAELIAAGVPRVAVVSLHPFGLPITDPLPPGAFDVTVAVRQQPDAYLHEPPSEGDDALVLEGARLSQDVVLARAEASAAAWGLEAGGRLLVDEGTAEPATWLAALAVPLVAAASVVLVGGDGIGLAEQERITATAR